MSEKITLQSLSEAFANANGVTKKLSESFLKQFFDVILEGLLADGVVKIKGLGTFKLVQVDARESISVSTGERVVIPGYKKVNFVPDEAFNALLKDAEEELVVEQKKDEFSGIDLLISTPESVEEVKDDLAKAREAAIAKQAEAEQALNAAREAHREVIRLEAMVERLERNAVVEPAAKEEEPDASEEEDEEVHDAADAPVTTASTEREENQNATADDGVETSTDEDEHKSKKHGWLIATIIILLLLLGGAGYYTYLNYFDKAPQPAKVKVVKRKTVKRTVPVDSASVKAMRADSAKADSLKTDSVAVDSLKKDSVGVPQPKATGNENGSSVALPIPQNTDTEVNAGETKTPSPKATTPPAPSERPKTYQIKEGDTLTKLARRFYGDASYAVDIIRANNFPDPDNVHVGTVITLP